MKKKIQSHFSGIGVKRFVIIAVMALILLDLMNSYYLRIYWVHKNLSMIYVEQLALRQGLDVSDLSHQSIQEIKGLIDNGFFFFLFIIFINNLFFYFFYLRKKIWAQGYVVFYTVTNALLAILFLIEGPILGMSWFIYNMSTILFYSYLYFGTKILKFEVNAIPEGEKSGQ
jgi:hypothetical protein